MGLYITLSDINGLQEDIMKEISVWARKEKTPISKKDIISIMELRGEKDFSILNALAALIRKGYIRKANMASNKTYYVQLRTVSLQ